MIKIKEVPLYDIKLVVEIHKDAFKGFFLTTLGDDFLNLYYTSLRKHPTGLIYGYYISDSLKGFCAATMHSQGFHKSIIRNNLLAFIKFGIKFLFTSFPKLIRLLKNLSKNKSSSNMIDNGNYAELLSIGISSNNQGQGIGRLLIEELEAFAKQKQINALSLTTDFYSNEKVISFYNSLGFEIYYEFVTFPDRKMYKMIKKFL